MESFNFYINVDQCLNMSNFDMFFYKLQHDQKFYLTNVNFNDRQGPNTMNSAIHDIRSYIDRTPFLITNYRLIFGMRTKRKQNPRWRDTVLYRLLTIYYTLRDQKLFIKSKEAADKNVSVIMLYETDFTLDMPELNHYESIADINILVKEAGIDLNTIEDPEEIQAGLESWLQKISGAAAEDGRDPKVYPDEITQRFLEEYLHYMNSKVSFTEDPSLSGDDNLYMLRQWHTDTEQEEADAHLKQSWLHSLNQFVKLCTEHYCVFIKEIDRNSLDQNLMALLSIVDYITSDLEYENTSDEITTNESMRQMSEDNWQRSTNDKNIRTRYGKMMFYYNQRLLEAGDYISRKELDLANGVDPDPYEKPDRIRESTSLEEQNRKAYREDILGLIRDFERKRLNKKTARKDWEYTYASLREKLSDLEVELTDYARKLTGKYKKEISRRKIDQRKNKKNYGYSPEAVEDCLVEDSRHKDKLLDELKKPQINSSLMFQDQLNLENRLETSNSEIKFYVKCLNMIQTVNFLLLILAGGGIFLFHYLLMQNYALGSGQMLSAMLLYILLAFVGFLFCWRAPYRYFQKKINKALKILTRDTRLYIDGYFKRAEDFSTYINIINEMDVLSSHIALLETFRKNARIYARKLLWHKVKVKEHISKASYFENMYATLDIRQFQEPDEERISREAKIDFTGDVLDNWVYWPQEDMI